MNKQILKGPIPILRHHRQPLAQCAQRDDPLRNAIPAQFAIFPIEEQWRQQQQQQQQLRYPLISSSHSSEIVIGQMTIPLSPSLFRGALCVDQRSQSKAIHTHTHTPSQLAIITITITNLPASSSSLFLPGFQNLTSPRAILSFFPSSSSSFSPKSLSETKRNPTNLATAAGPPRHTPISTFRNHQERKMVLLL